MGPLRTTWSRTSRYGILGMLVHIPIALASMVIYHLMHEEYSLADPFGDLWIYHASRIDHVLLWIVPFMIIGIAAGSFVAWTTLQVEARVRTTDQSHRERALVTAALGGILIQRQPGARFETSGPVPAALLDDPRFDHVPDQSDQQWEARHEDQIWLVVARWSDEGKLDALVIDITEKRDLEQQIQSFEQRLQHSRTLATIGRMATETIHEVNSGLGTISATAENILRQDPDSEHRDRLDGMLDTIDRLSRSVARLRQLGREEDTSSSTDFSEVVSTTASVVRRLHLDNHVNIALELEPAQIGMSADDGQQLIANLLLNSIQAGATQIQVEARGQNGQVIVEVRDDGRGVPVEDRDQLLAPGFTTRTGGMGLGLAIVREIVELHEGELAFEFPSRGTTVRIVLPGVSP